MEILQLIQYLFSKKDKFKIKHSNQIDTVYVNWGEYICE